MTQQEQRREQALEAQRCLAAGITAFDENDPFRAKELHDHAIELFQATNWKAGLAEATEKLALLFWVYQYSFERESAVDRAEELWHRSIALNAALAKPANLGCIYANLSMLYDDRARDEGFIVDPPQWTDLIHESEPDDPVYDDDIPF